MGYAQRNQFGDLFLIWTIWAWWAIAEGLLVVCFAYLLRQGTVEVYGDLLGSAFDLYRAALYKSLRWPLPANPGAERKIGMQLRAYLWWGSDKFQPIFRPAEK